MRHPWRQLGLAVILLFLGLLVADVLQRLPDRPSRTPFPPGPPGFRQKVAGLGTLEIAQRGPVVLGVEEPRPGGGGRYRMLRVEGRDPEPAEGGGMLLRDVVLHRFDPDGSPVSTTRAPRAWIPLAEGHSELRVSTEREWRLEQPEIVLTPARGGRQVALDAREVLLDPRRGSARAPGPFTARSGGLVVSSSDLEADPNGDLRWQGDVTWSFPAGGGEAYRGQSDAGGELRRLDDGRDLLRLPARKSARILLPPSSGIPGTLETAGIELRLARQAGGGPPRPLEARGAAPTRFLGAVTTVQGQEAAARWRPASEQEGDAGGDAGLESLELAGPLTFRHQRDDGSEVTGSAVGRALYRLAEAIPVLEGGVVLEAAEGSLACQRLAATGDGAWRLAGPVVLRPAASQVRRLEAPSALYRPGVRGLFEEGFVLAGVDSGGEWTARGQWLDVSMDAAGRPARLEARGGIVWNRGGAIFRGERLVRRGERETRLEGLPATGQVPLPEAEGAIVELEAGTFILLGEEQDLVLREEPRLRLPASLLELPPGADVTVRADSMRWRKGEESWELTRAVRLEGGLRGEARRGAWRAAEGLTLEGPRDRAWVAGKRPDGTTFRLAGRRLHLQERTVIVEEDAEATFQRPGEEDAWTVRSDRLVVTGEGGTATGRVRISGPGVEGHAARARWETVAGGEGQEGAGPSQRLVLEEGAVLQGEPGFARGDRLAYDAAAGLLEAWGEPALVRLAEGRTARGRHLRLHLAWRLLAGEDLVIEPGTAKP